MNLSEIQLLSTKAKHQWGLSSYGLTQLKNWLSEGISNLSRSAVSPATNAAEEEKWMQSRS